MAGSLVTTPDTTASSVNLTMRYVAQLLNLQRLSGQVFNRHGNRELYEQLLIFRRDNYLELVAARERAKVAFCEYAKLCEKSYSEQPVLADRVGNN